MFDSWWKNNGDGWNCFEQNKVILETGRKQKFDPVHACMFVCECLFQCTHMRACVCICISKCLQVCEYAHASVCIIITVLFICCQESTYNSFYTIFSFVSAVVFSVFHHFIVHNKDLARNCDATDLNKLTINQNQCTLITSEYHMAYVACNIGSHWSIFFTPMLIDCKISEK